MMMMMMMMMMMVMMIMLMMVDQTTLYNHMSVHTHVRTQVTVGYTHVHMHVQHHVEMYAHTHMHTRVFAQLCHFLALGLTLPFPAMDLVDMPVPKGLPEVLFPELPPGPEMFLPPGIYEANCTGDSQQEESYAAALEEAEKQL